ncbi:hypothetical protein CH54_3797 [Yersinia rochesterensis]|uniref:Phage protein n=1 Tax=Yersinia rochesterensis TaxID=1604335 RepID=A0ABM5SQX8_9GAMM|nr:hypothetical protein [Yersinia rochesterensis]AJI87102.1 hypothetical protein AW19_1988 [Yersinia frederiksenii Y225]AJJ36968.1 hypothetical protein CH54_3797 [Yersinia rochesterensis]
MTTAVAKVHVSELHQLITDGEALRDEMRRNSDQKNMVISQQKELIDQLKRANELHKTRIRNRANRINRIRGERDSALAKLKSHKSKSITLSKHQYRQLCDAYANTVNMMPQLLMITPLQDDRSPDALYALQTALQTVQQQLKSGLKLR